MLEIRAHEMSRRGVGALGMLADLQAGLIDGAGRGQRTLPPKYFYDLRGSQLFEEITRLPEYYLTRTERALLATRMPATMAMLRPGALIELGAGNADKTRTILAAIREARPDVVYVPVDVSATFLTETARALRNEFPELRVVPVVADFVHGVEPPRGLQHPVVWAFLGSTIGNLEDPEAERLLAGIQRHLTREDRLLLGADLVKDRRVLEAAYNDARGVTAAFNRNVLTVLNRELGADFEPTAFAHRAVFDGHAGRIEMHLVAVRDQCIHVPGLPTLMIPRGESIRTEISNKYTPERLQRLLTAAGLALCEWDTDDAGGYALMLVGRRS
jgi:L-histidine N-alpha-methyltransferase